MDTIKRQVKIFGRGFVEGFSSLFGLSMEEPEIKTKSFYDDRKALKQDWENIGQDMEKAIHRFEKEQEGKGIPA